MPDKKRVLILCSGNSARSQIAEGLLRHDAGDRFDVFSAGTTPSSVRPEAITVMRELSIDISGHRSKSVNEFAGQPFDYVLTICDNARKGCPVFPGAGAMIHQNFEDPGAFESPEEQRLTAFRRVRDQLRQYLASFPPTFRFSRMTPLHPIRWPWTVVTDSLGVWASSSPVGAFRNGPLD